MRRLPTVMTYRLTNETKKAQRNVLLRAERTYDPSYEWKAVTLMALGFGLVGLDRWLVAPLFPFMARDLHLNYEQLGGILGILGVAWGVFAIPVGRLSDRIGRRRILFASIMAFSLLSGFTGLATGFGMLILCRTLMGATEGSFLPVSVAVTAEASPPQRVGLNEGLQLSMFALFGLGLGPIIATQLLGLVPSWRWVFVLVALPGVILAVLILLVIRERDELGIPQVAASARGSWLGVLARRNVILSIFGLLCAMCGVFVLGAMLPSYLIDVLHLTRQQMGFVVSAIGFGGFVGQFGIAGLSDRFGRRPMGCISFVASAFFVTLFSRTGPDPVALFALLFVATIFCFGLLALFTGPVPTEAVEAGLTASAVGLVSGCAEIFGGGVAPALAGFIAQHFGLQNIFILAIGGLLVGTVFAFLLTETAPLVLGRRQTRRAAARPDIVRH